MGSKMKKKEDRKTSGLINSIFSWSIYDILNKNLYKDKVNRIPATFSSANQYFNSFIYALLEETRADLCANMKILFHAPSCEISGVNRILESPNILLYNLSLKAGVYMPAFGDLIALTDVKPRYIDDLHPHKRPYAVALVEGKEHGHSVMKILSSKHINFKREDKENGELGNKLFAVYLTNMITNLRIWTALHPDVNRGNMKIINSVLGSKPSLGVEEQCRVCKTSKSTEAVSCFELDDSQKAAVLNCIATTECHHQNEVKLIWGPPGTGKTKTVASLLFSLFTVKRRTLTCAPTNIAVIGVAKRLIGLLGSALKHETYGLGDVVLFGNGERMNINDHVELSDVFLDNRVDVLASCFSGWKSSLEYMICLLKDPESQFLRYLGEENRKKSDEERNEENQITTKEECSGSDGITRKCEKEKFVKSLEKKVWKKIHVHSLEGGRVKKLKDQKDIKNEDKRVEKSNGACIPSTFEQFFIQKFQETSKQLKLSITGLYTHMPTSCLPVEVLSNMIEVLELIQALQNLLNKFDVPNGGLMNALKGNGGQKHATNLHGISLIRFQCLKVLLLLRNYKMSVPKYQIRSFCLKNTCLILCTASTSAKLHTEGMSPIEVVIIDEAAQLKECESCIPLQLHGVRHAILVGDAKQLPAMVQSKICESAAFGRSLFERLVILGHSKHLLNVQCRMHPPISSFPNREFYDEEIRNGPNVTESAYEQRFLDGEMFGSYSFIDINMGSEEFDDRHSHKNMVEVAVIAEIVSKLYRETLLSKQKLRVGCISPYKAQVFATQERLGNSYSTNVDKFSVNIRSVDGFQGGEEDVIIISTVRCNEKGLVGFLSTFQRVNVALTRARYCLWIVGNSSTLLKSGSVWKNLVLDAKSRNCFHNANKDKSLARVIDNALVEIGHWSTLFRTDSILFKTSKWKVCFSVDFQESMIKLQHHSGIHKCVSDLLVKLSNGWREQLKDESLGEMEGASAQLLEIYDVNERYKLIWTVEILREDSTDIQVIKVWGILRRNKIQKRAKKLDAEIGKYTSVCMTRCLCKRIVRELTLPMTWLVNTSRFRS